MFKSLKEKKTDPFRLHLVGEPETGKTSSLASLVNLGYNLYVLDFDQEKTMGLRRRLESEENIFIASYYDETREDDISKKDKKNTGYKQAIEDLTLLKSKGVLDDKKTIIVLDTITNMCKSIMIDFEGGNDTRLNYNRSNEEFLTFMTKIAYLTKNCNLICLGHTGVFEFEGKPPKIGVETVSKKNSISYGKLSAVACLHVIERNDDGKGGSKIEVNTTPGYLKLVKNPYEGIPGKVSPDLYLAQMMHFHYYGEWVTKKEDLKLPEND